MIFIYPIGIAHELFLEYWIMPLHFQILWDGFGWEGINAVLVGCLEAIEIHPLNTKYKEAGRLKRRTGVGSIKYFSNGLPRSANH